MIQINENYLELKSSYLFSEIAKRVTDYQKSHPEKKIIRLGIGDVTRALPQACIERFHAAVDEMAKDETFRGYGPEQGYEFLRKAIADSDYRALGAEIAPDEIFISDGSKCDTGNIQELFAQDISIAIPDPVYPVYFDTNVMAGRKNKITLLPATSENNFVPGVPKERADLIYLCFPNNPTGAVATTEQLTSWVEYAKRNQSLILFDAAYVAFIRDPKIPKSIFQIPGAREVAIEFRSFSKTAGFTGTRCAYVALPKDVCAWDRAGKAHALHAQWNRRQTTKFNGTSYPVQRAAEAVYSAAGKRQVVEITDYYMRNAKLIREEITKLGLACSGGENAPYVWIRCGTDSWTFFDRMLEKAGVVCTPGEGFGKCGEGYIRLSAFNSFEAVSEALNRIRTIFS